ncbi:MAG: hypothetical protein MK479_07105 [Planctomycetes bacterium]|nr:hypothetical protein [Planctomycetota bacterium]
MLDRESTFKDPEIVSLLKSRFIPVAIDQAYQRRQKDTEGDFYRKIAGQGPRNNFKGTTQGLYLATASGKLLGFNNNRGGDRIRRMMKKALDGFEAPAAAVIKRSKVDARYNPKPPEGGLVVRVQTKVLGGYEKTEDRWRKIFQNALSRDNLWVTKEEHEALAAGKVPSALQKRIARYHLVDNTRGEPPMWKADEIRSIEFSLEDGRLSGCVHLETASGKRGYKVSLLGRVEKKDGRITRFDLVARGEFWGEGTYTRGAPKGRFPLAASFTLADGSDIADGVPPQGSRGWVRGYLRQ